MCIAPERKELSTFGLPESLLEELHSTLCQSGQTLALAESCTGGMIGEVLTSMAGSSSYFLGGIVTYSNSAKENVLGVSGQSIREHGAVSQQVAREMAQGARQEFSSDLALSITGIAGPGGGSEEKPVGTFFVGLSTPSISLEFHNHYSAPRNLLRRYAAFKALDYLRRHILALPFPNPVQ